MVCFGEVTVRHHNEATHGSTRQCDGCSDDVHVGLPQHRSVSLFSLKHMKMKPEISPLVQHYQISINILNLAALCKLIISTWLVITYIYLYNLRCQYLYILLLKWLPCQLWQSELGFVMLSCFSLRLHGFQGLAGKRPAPAKTKTITLEDPQLKFDGKESDSPTFCEWWMMNGSVWRWRLDNPRYSSGCKESKNHRIKVGLVKP